MTYSSQRAAVEPFGSLCAADLVKNRRATGILASDSDVCLVENGVVGDVDVEVEIAILEKDAYLGGFLGCSADSLSGWDM